MKYTVTFLAVLLACVQINAQQLIDTRKYIEVTGSAEMTVAPDEVELEISLQEYDKAGKKIKLEEISRDFTSVLVKHHVDTSSVSFISSSDFYWWYWWSQRDKYYQRRTVTIKLNEKVNVLKLVEDLNEKWVESIRIAKSTHSRITEYRKQVKEDAALAAKNKAAYLLKVLGEEPGGVLSVDEMPDTYNNYWWNSAGNMMSNATSFNYSQNAPDNSGVNGVSSIKLRYEIKVKFSIK